jgi:flagellar hook assembly protein FlgD
MASKGDGFEDFCIIQYNLPLTTSLIRITIFDIKGRLLRTLANSELSGPHGEIIWDGLDDEKQRVRIGPYVVFVEAIDGQAGILATTKAVVVVATKL